MTYDQKSDVKIMRKIQNAKLLSGHLLVFTIHRLESLFQIGNDIVNMFNANA
jgi:hypothetical protein